MYTIEELSTPAYYSMKKRTFWTRGSGWPQKKIKKLSKGRVFKNNVND